MALSEFERKRISHVVGEYVESKRPEPCIRNKVDIGFRIADQSFEIYEARPNFMDPKEKIESPVAKATYVKSSGIWKLYWMRADLKWHRYEPLADTAVLERVLQEIDQDPYSCFWG